MGDQGVFLPGAVVLQVRCTARQYVALVTLGEALASVRSSDPLTGVARAEVQLVAAVCLVRGGGSYPKRGYGGGIQGPKAAYCSLGQGPRGGAQTLQGGGPGFGAQRHF